MKPGRLNWNWAVQALTAFLMLAPCAGTGVAGPLAKAESGGAAEMAGRGHRPAVLKFSCGYVPLGGTYLASAAKGTDGVLEAHGAMARAQPLGAMAGMEEGTPETRVCFPNLRVGDIVPVFGALYRVTRIEDLGVPEELRGKDLRSLPKGTLLRRDWMTMALAEKKGLPPGLTFQEGSTAIPLRRGGAGPAPPKLADAWLLDGDGSAQFEFVKTFAFVVAKAEPVAADDAWGPVAEVKVTVTDRVATRVGGSAPVFATKTTNVRVRRGDVLAIGERSYKVRNVVPRDPKQHVIGWIELDPGGTEPLPRQLGSDRPGVPGSPRTPPLGEPPFQALEFRGGFVPLPLDGEYQTYLRSAGTGKDAVVEARGAVASAKPRDGRPRFAVWYPDLSAGDIVPVFGRLYRVDKVVDLGQPKEWEAPVPKTGIPRNDWMTMSLVDGKSLPPGLAYHEGSIAVPLNHGHHGSADFAAGNVRVTFTGAGPADPDDPRGPVAEITISAVGKAAWSINGAAPAAPMKSTTEKIRRGDVLAIGERTYKVRNVVPRDPKQHVIGWIELDPGTGVPSEPGPGSKQSPKGN